MCVCVTSALFFSFICIYNSAFGADTFPPPPSISNCCVFPFFSLFFIFYYPNTKVFQCRKQCCHPLSSTSSAWRRNSIGAYLLKLSESLIYQKGPSVTFLHAQHNSYEMCVQYKNNKRSAGLAAALLFTPTEFPCSSPKFQMTTLSQFFSFFAFLILEKKKKRKQISLKIGAKFLFHTIVILNKRK